MTLEELAKVVRTVDEGSDDGAYKAIALAVARVVLTEAAKMCQHHDDCEYGCDCACRVHSLLASLEAEAK